MPKTNNYSQEFKNEVLAYMDATKEPLGAVASYFGIARNTLREWRRRAAPLRIRHSLETQIEEGLSVRENRRPVHEAWRFTDCERDLSRIEDGVTVTYLNAQIEHDKITQGSNLDDSAAKLKSWFWAAHPFMRYIDETIEAPLAVEIFECDPLHPGEAELRYTGDIDDVNPEGRSLTANTTVLGAMLETKVPAFFVQAACNHDFCDEECGLLDADFTCAGTITAINGGTLTVALTRNPGLRPLASGWFAGGWVSAGLGERYQAREILRSDGDTAGQTLTIDRAFNGINVGEAVEFCPTCPGTCDANDKTGVSTRNLQRANVLLAGAMSGNVVSAVGAVRGAFVSLMRPVRRQQAEHEGLSEMRGVEDHFKCGMRIAECGVSRRRRLMSGCPFRRGCRWRCR